MARLCCSGRGASCRLNTLELLARSLKQGWEPQLKLVVDAAFPREHLLKIVAELQQLCPNTQMQLSDAVLSGAEEAIADGLADVVVTAHVPTGYFGEFLRGCYFRRRRAAGASAVCGWA